MFEKREKMTKQEALLILQALPDDTEVTIILGKHSQPNRWQMPYTISYPPTPYWQDPYKVTCTSYETKT